MNRVDFHTATAFRISPSYSQVCLDPEAPPFPDEFLDEAACTSPTSLLQLSVAPIDCFNIFYRLHRLALAGCSHWRGQVNRLTLSNLLYESEYLILLVPDYSRDFLDFDMEEHNEQDSEYELKKGAANAASVVEGLLAASQIFNYAALRDIPITTRIFSILLERLSIAIARPSVCTIDIWRKERNLNLLLWSLVVACSVIQPGTARTWWIKLLADVLDELRINSRFDLEMALKHVVWLDGYFDRVLGELWDEALHRR